MGWNGTGHDSHGMGWDEYCFSMNPMGWDGMSRIVP
ncbi:unnamed protein product, partial [Adineta steineri]